MRSTDSQSGARDRDADAARQLDLAAGHVQRRRERAQHALRDLARGLGGLHVFEQHDELVAGDARDDVGIAHATRQAPGHLLQHGIAGAVAQAVVDHLEAVDVDVEQAEAATVVATRAGERALDAIAQVDAVRQAGQRIVHDLVLQLRFDLFAHGDLFAQLDGARFDAMLEFGVRLAQQFRRAPALQRAADLVGDEGQQFGVAFGVDIAAVVALHGDDADRALGAQQRCAQPHQRRRTEHAAVDLAGRHHRGRAHRA